MSARPSSRPEVFETWRENVEGGTVRLSVKGVWVPIRAFHLRCRPNTIALTIVLPPKCLLTVLHLHDIIFTIVIQTRDRKSDKMAKELMKVLVMMKFVQ